MTSSNFYDRIIQQVATLAAGFPASENHLGEVGGNMGFVTNGFGRPSNTTPYQANQALTRSGNLPLSFVSVPRLAGKSGYITSAICNTLNPAMTGQLRLHLFTASPAQIASDGSSFLVHSDNDPYVLGWIDFTTFITGGAGSNSSRSAGTLNPSPLAFRSEAGSTTLYGLVQSLNAWTPVASQYFSFQFFGDRY